MISIRSVRAYLSLGTNIGQREQNLHKAAQRLDSRGVQIRVCSSVYETEPVGYADQPDFLNLVCEVRTFLSPPRLLETCLEIELELGRTRSIPQGPRTIDIDILYYGARIIDEPDLIIPHPRLYERAFVLVPLREIAADLRDPRSKRRVGELVAACRDRAKVVRIGSAEELKVWP